MDSVTLELYRHRYAGVAEEMGEALKRTGFSPNIKERLDFSCAIFDGDGALVAQAAHIPVHLGAMSASVEAARAVVAEWREGDVVILNDPFRGGTHLPDVTVVAPVFCGSGTPDFFVANRAHHADIGGMSPGSLPLSREIYQEGLIIPPLLLVENGKRNDAVWQLILRNTRTPDERDGDLKAQLAALFRGNARLRELADNHGQGEVTAYARHLQTYAEKRARAAIASWPDGRFEASDWLEVSTPQAAEVPANEFAAEKADPQAGAPRKPAFADKNAHRVPAGGRSDKGLPAANLFAGTGSQFAELAKIRLAVTIEGDAIQFDFTGTSPQVAGSLNAVEAIAHSACYYVVACLLGPDVPLNAGTFAPVKVTAPCGSVVNAQSPAAVAGGNVETSQRIVDVVLQALNAALPNRIPACSAGTMNNVTMGGIGADGAPWTYYETLGGGAGAAPMHEGASAVQTHMTNTLNTPIEALERAFPLRVKQYCVRRESGGAGAKRGGDGLVRQYEFVSSATVTMLSTRRATAPLGAFGGKDGACGRNVMNLEGKARELPAQFTREFAAGEKLTIETPGGGGCGKVGD